MTDREKLNAFEAWLKDDGEGQEKGNRYPVISVLVQSGDYFRIFTTTSFSCRALVTLLWRYNPNYQILAVKYGEFACDCPRWEKDYEMCEEDGLLPINERYTREELLRNFDFRTAVNLFYIYCSQDGKYPAKSPFKGVKCWTPEEFAFVVHERPIFVPQEQCFEGDDVFKYYDGKWIERWMNGEKRSGYYLTEARITNENGDE